MCVDFAPQIPADSLPYKKEALLTMYCSKTITSAGSPPKLPDDIEKDAEHIK
jgi:hypothetical protein